MDTEKLNYKSDFKLFESCDTGYATPFRFSYYTDSPAKSYEVTYDGNTYENCKLMDDGRLCVAFDDHGMGLGILKVERRYYLTDEDYATGICDEVITAAPVECVKDDGTTYTITLALKGDKTITATSQVPAYYQKGDKGDPGLTTAEHDALVDATDAANNAATTATTAATNANDAATAATTATEQIAQKITDCETATTQCQTATSEAENVNATLDEDTRTFEVTDRNGEKKSLTLPEGGKYMIVNVTGEIKEGATTDKTSEEVASAMNDGTDIFYIGAFDSVQSILKANTVTNGFISCYIVSGNNVTTCVHYGNTIFAETSTFATSAELADKADQSSLNETNEEVSAISRKVTTLETDKTDVLSVLDEVIADDTTLASINTLLDDING